MTRTHIPVGLPHPNPTKAYWQTPPLPIADHRTTPNLPASAKYVIVGSGICGTSIASKLLAADPGASIVMLEARQACSGATGRNGGWCRAARYESFQRDVDAYGVEEAILLDRLEEENVRGVVKLIEDEGIDCDLDGGETFDIWTDQVQWDEALTSLKARQKALEGRGELRLSAQHKVWSAKDTREQLRVPEGVGAVSYHGHNLSPYKFVCALLQILLRKGVNLQTNTPVVEVSQAPTREGQSHWCVSTERGDIVAEKVILATNAYTAALYPPLADFIIPTRGQIAAIRPGSGMIGRPALLRPSGLTSAITGDYFHVRKEGFSGAGDLIMGGGRRLGTNGEQPILDDSVINPKISHWLKNSCSHFFGKENWGENGETIQEWTGIMGYTKDRQPLIGEAPGKPGLWICAGFNGHGMALTFQSAEALVQLLMGGEEVHQWLPRCYRLSRVPGLSSGGLEI